MASIVLLNKNEPLEARDGLIVALDVIAVISALVIGIIYAARPDLIKGSTLSNYLIGLSSYILLTMLLSCCKSQKPVARVPVEARQRPEAGQRATTHVYVLASGHGSGHGSGSDTYGPGVRPVEGLAGRVVGFGQANPSEPRGMPQGNGYVLGGT